MAKRKNAPDSREDKFPFEEAHEIQLQRLKLIK